MSTEFLALPGAVEADGPDAGVASHYGNPLVEQRALDTGEAVVDLSHRSVLTVKGEDRLIWLHNISSQALTGLRPGDAAETLLLSATGRIDHALHLLDDGVSVWIVVERETADALHAFLESMRFMMRVAVDDRSDEFAVLGSMGDAGIPADAPHGIPLVWDDPWAQLVQGGHQYAHADTHPGSQWRWRETIIERDRLAEAAAAAPAAGILAFEALRVAAWRPRFGADVDDRSIPHELDWMRSAVHLTKGCYRGQETIAKVHNLGHPPRRFVMLHVDGSEGAHPAHGDEVRLGDKAVGHVTSAALHYEQGPIALAVVKRMTRVEATLTVATSDGDVAAAQEVIVPTDAGATANVPRLPRLGASPRG